MLTAATTPGVPAEAGAPCTGALSTGAPAAASISAGVMRTRRGRPSARAASASRTTIGSEHAPPTQPSRRPSGVTTALSPTRADTGGSTRTTVASAYGRPVAVTAESPHTNPFSCMTAQTLSLVTGISMLVTPSGARASSTALT